MRPRPIPPCALTVALYTIGCILFSVLLSWLHWPDVLLMLAAVPILWAAFRFPGWAYLAMTGVAIGCAIWVTDALSPPFSYSQQTILVTTITWLGVAGLIHELVAARNRAEEAYRAVVESSAQGMAILQDRRPVFVNPAICAILSYTQKDLLALSSQQVYALIHPEDRAATLTALEPMDEQSGAVEGHFRLIGRDGRVIWADARASAIAYRGRPATQIALNNYTAQREAERALRQSEERLRLVVENTGDIVMMQDLEGRYLYFNSSPEYSINDHETVGRTPYDLLDPVSAERLVARVKKVAAAGQPLNEETPLPWRGETLYFSDLLSPVKDANGQVVAVVTASRNVTARRRAEDALRASEATPANHPARRAHRRGAVGQTHP